MNEVAEPIAVGGLWRYPMKSGRREVLTFADVEPWGLRGDRRWMVVDADGTPITGREVPRLTLLYAAGTGDGLVLVAPDGRRLSVPFPDDGPVSVNVWRDPFPARAAGPRADAWLTGYLDRPCRLVYLADPTVRPVNPRFGGAADRVSFADGYPVHLITEASLADVARSRAPEHADDPPVQATRFRPNILVSGTRPWEEDGWRRVLIGAVTFRVVKGCDRCVMTLLEPDTAVSGREPLRTLARVRRWEGASWFGMYLIPDAPGRITVGDGVRVLARESSDGPPR